LKSPIFDDGAVQSFYNERAATALNPEVRRAAESFAKEIFEGKLHSRQIHYPLYSSTASTLIESVLKGFESKFEYNAPSNALLDHLQTNVFAFSAAKSLNEYEAFSRFLVKDGKRVATFGEFKKAVKETDTAFNERYLQAEYDSAIAQGQMAEKWQEFEANREAGGQLQYRTAGDERVRDSHRILDGKIFNLDDEILNRIYPPNDWNCRCTMVQVNAPGRVTPSIEWKVLEEEAKVPDYFKHNSGKSGAVYQDGHPYFKNTSGILKQLTATKSYGMHDPEKIYQDYRKLTPNANPLTLDEFKSWYEKRVKDHGNSALGEFSWKVKPLNNLHVTFDKDLYLRTTQSSKYVSEKRFSIAPDLETTINNPDEIWTSYQNSRHAGSDLLTVFIKYFQDKPMVAVVKSAVGQGKGYIRLASYYKMDKMKYISQFRVGILRYRKTKS
jgi:SPP1 gp7 family putative phage head morphogenesis protein